MIPLPSASGQFPQLSAINREQYYHLEQELSHLLPEDIMAQLDQNFMSSDIQWSALRARLQMLVDKGILELLPYHNMNIPWEWNELCLDRECWPQTKVDWKGWKDWKDWPAYTEELLNHFKHIIVVTKVIENLHAEFAQDSIPDHYFLSEAPLLVYKRERLTEDTPFMYLLPSDSEQYEPDLLNDAQIAYNEGHEYKDYFGYFDENYPESPVEYEHEEEEDYLSS